MPAPIESEHPSHTLVFDGVFFAGGSTVLMSPMVHTRLLVSRMEPKTRRSAMFLWGALVGITYYVGALVGFELKFPSHSPSALWPPNSILLAALLLLPMRHWWVVLLGAFPAHLLVQLPRDVPVVMSLAFLLSNSCEALLGAFLIRRSIDGPLRFDGLKSAGVFVLAAVVVAPFLSSFLDACFVTLIGWQQESYWNVWRARLPSNALAALAIAPVIVLWANDGPAWLRRVATRQRVEALIMVGGLVAVSALVFAWQVSGRDATPALLLLPLPFLLWAAVRFGPPATSASLLILIFVSIWGAAKGLGPFAALSPRQNVLSLQMFLLAISVPLIFLAAVIEERRKKEQSLRESEERFRTMADTAPVLIWTADADKLCTYVSRTWLDLTGRTFEEELGNGWAHDIHPSDRDARLEAYAHCFDRRSPFTLEYRVRRHDGEYRWLLDKGTPRFASDSSFLGYIGSATDITERKRLEERLRVQHTVAQILAEAATIEEATPRILRAMGECLGWEVGALWRVDREAGALRCVELWHKASIEVPEFERVSREFTFARGVGLPGRVWSSLEPEYIPDVVPDANFPRGSIAERENLHAAFGFPILLGKEVLGVIEFFSREIRQPDQELLNMLATIGSQIGQFIERKGAEEALREAQAELGRMGRLTLMGELMASVAHEINQPLGAAVNDATACVRWLAAHNLEEARQSAAMVIEAGHRAAEIISRIRALAQKAPPEKTWLNLNDTIRDVIALARSELDGNRVLLRAELRGELPPILGDRIQLQQVLLNLMMNAIEAMSGVVEGQRELVVCSARDESKNVRVAVQDSGPGPDPKNLERLFDAFYTTKEHGLGLGLAISRRIIEAHGGRLWATANAPCGAIFQFTLPVGEARAR
jgi:PAS domain S-box-containing protein